LIVSLKRDGDHAARIKFKAGSEWKEFSTHLKAPHGEYRPYYAYKGQGAVNFSLFVLE
jgi:hypothetical protein